MVRATTTTGTGIERHHASAKLDAQSYNLLNFPWEGPYPEESPDWCCTFAGAALELPHELHYVMVAAISRGAATRLGN